MFCKKENSGCKGKSVILLTALLAFGLGAFFNYTHALPPHAVPANLRMTVLKTPRSVNAFDLEQYQQPSFTNKSLSGKWTMMFFGFSDCPQLCPTTMATLNKVYTQLQEQHAKQLPQVVLVSVDPEQDTAKRISEYAKGFNPNFIGVRAEKDKIDALTRELGIAYFKIKNQDQKSDKSYSINHSGTIILFNPEGKLAGFFSVPHEVNSIANEFVKVTGYLG